MDNAFTLKKGDLITQQEEDLTWQVIKIIEIDKWPDNTHTAHCLIYQPADEKPDADTTEKLEKHILHTPVDAENFQKNWELLGNKQLTEDELTGFTEYLKITDFQRYAEFTHQDISKIVAQANEIYTNAIALAEQGKHTDAISTYTEAFEIFPLFYEAIDNRGFTYMDIGQYEKALDDFQYSLQLNPDGVTAFFTKGECLLKLNRTAEAADVFQQGMLKFPDEKQLFSDFHDKTIQAEEH
ncbi:hypothetical protein MNBD_GAMMA11-2738 [hydrothermal vent metagenome]|uniref:Uncharacterized protein n=1 Tax=hydrothermal vent metagenome TaxID=652676 RepID=A0A3B0X4F6_9ZZZZ